VWIRCTNYNYNNYGSTDNYDNNYDNNYGSTNYNYNNYGSTDNYDNNNNGSTSLLYIL
jgi:hypothetical protein